MVILREFKSTATCLVAAGALALAGCSSNGSSAPSSAPAAPNASASATSPAPAAPGPDADLASTTFAVDLDRALAVAEQTQPGGTVTKIEVDYDRAASAWVWKVDSQQGTDQHEIKIDAQSGRVLADDRDQESANPVPVDPRKLTPKDAIARAVAVQPGTVAKWALEYDDGAQRYAIDIRTSGSDSQAVLVDVDSGTASKKK